MPFVLKLHISDTHSIEDSLPPCSEKQWKKGLSGWPLLLHERRYVHVQGRDLMGRVRKLRDTVCEISKEELLFTSKTCWRSQKIIAKGRLLTAWFTLCMVPLQQTLNARNTGYARNILSPLRKLVNFTTILFDSEWHSRFMISLSLGNEGVCKPWIFTHFIMPSIYGIILASRQDIFWP